MSGAGGTGGPGRRVLVPPCGAGAGGPRARLGTAAGPGSARRAGDAGRAVGSAPARLPGSLMSSGKGFCIADSLRSCVRGFSRHKEPVPGPGGSVLPGEEADSGRCCVLLCFLDHARTFGGIDLI